MRSGTIRAAVVVVAALLACRVERESTSAPAIAAPPAQPQPEAMDAAAPSVTPADEAAAVAPAPGASDAVPPAAAPGEGEAEPAELDAASPSSPRPAGLVARAVSPKEIALSWGAGTAEDVVQFEVLRAGAVLTRSASASAVDRAVLPGHRYCYAVVAVDAAGHRSAPSRGACAITPDAVPPTAPGTVAVSPTSDRALAISWSAATDDGAVAGYEVFRGEVRVAATGALAAAEAELQPAQRYCYAVEALDRAGNRSPRSAETCATTPDLTPPSVPTTLVPHPWGEREMGISWGASHDDVGVAGYELLRDGKVVAKTAETNVPDRGLAPWREYCYAVRAYDAAGNLSAPTGPSCAKTHDLTAPTVPEAVAEAVSDRAVGIDWTASTDNVAVDAYEVQRDGRTLRRIPRLHALEEGLEPAREYCYSVRAVDPAGNASPWSQACATTPDLTPPTRPARFAVGARAATQVIAVWEASQDDVGVAAYEILRGEEVVASGARPSAVLGGLAPEKQHCFAVRARDAAGNLSPVAGPLCATTPDLATPPGPANLRLEVVETDVRLQWEPSTRPDVVYAVYGEANRRVGMTRDRKYTLAGALSGSLAGRDGCYRVAAVDDAGRESPKSLPACHAERLAAAR